MLKTTVTFLLSYLKPITILKMGLFISFSVVTTGLGVSTHSVQQRLDLISVKSVTISLEKQIYLCTISQLSQAYLAQTSEHRAK